MNAWLIVLVVIWCGAVFTPLGYLWRMLDEQKTQEEEIREEFGEEDWDA